MVHLAIYVGFDRALSLSSTLSEIANRRFLLVGTVALALMAPLAITSTNAMIRRLTARRWKRLHRLAYVVTALAVLHFYMLVKSDIREPVAFAVVVGLLLALRFGRHYQELLAKAALSDQRGPAPQLPAKPESRSSTSRWSGELAVGAIVQETPDVKTFRLVAPHGQFPFEYQAGQFLNLQLEIEGRRVNRSYTIASSPTRPGCCELTIKREAAGLASRFLHDRLQVGDRLKVSGPAGRFVFSGDEHPEVLLIAGGVGITPLMSMVRSLVDRNWSGTVSFLIVAKSAGEVIFREELARLQSQFPRLRLLVTLTREPEGSEWSGSRGRVTPELLRSFVPKVAEVPVYLCGPHEMMDATRDVLLSVGVPAERIQTEAFAGKNKGTSAVAPLVPEVKNPVQAVGDASVRFARSNRTAVCDRRMTILEAAEADGVAIDSECRSGICGQCVTRLVSGEVEMERDDALASGDRRRG